MGRITTPHDLRTRYGEPSERAARKVLPKLDRHTMRFVSLSPFVLLGTSDGRGNADVTPRGEAPGFIAVLDETTLALPDRPGNNRLDTLTNLLTEPSIGMLFLIPGFSEMLRINGTAEIRDDEVLLDRFAIGGKRPATVLVILIREVFLHCAKAIMRSHLWDETKRTDRSLLPTMGQMLKEHAQLSSPAETTEETLTRNKAELY